MDANQATASQLRAVLAARRITRRQMAALIDRDATWVQRRCTGNTPITVGDLDLIAAALDIPITDLLPEKASA